MAESSENTMANPVYEATGLPSKAGNDEGERDLHNPIYGMPDDDQNSLTGIVTSH